MRAHRVWWLVFSLPLWILLLLMAAVRASAEDRALPDAPVPRAMEPVVVVTPARLPSTWPSRWSTAASFSLRTADSLQTCALMHRYGRRVHEDMLPTQSCGGIVGIDMGYAALAWLAEWQLRKHGHPRLARWPQWASAVGSGVGIVYTMVMTRGMQR